MLPKQLSPNNKAYFEGLSPAELQHIHWLASKTMKFEAVEVLIRPSRVQQYEVIERNISQLTAQEIVDFQDLKNRNQRLLGQAASILVLGTFAGTVFGVGVATPSKRISGYVGGGTVLGLFGGLAYSAYVSYRNQAILDGLFYTIQIRWNRRRSLVPPPIQGQVGAALMH
jgi:hypothetical protein